MKIEHIEFYDFFDCYSHHMSESVLYDLEFNSLYHVALTVREMLTINDKPVFRQAIVFMDNWRYLLVNSKSYDVHFHGNFEHIKKQIGKPIFSKL